MIEDAELRRPWQSDRRIYLFTQQEDDARCAAALAAAGIVAGNPYKIVVKNRAR
ncbi:MAG TPA: hypothetical protein VHL99_08285 [Candidatus Binatia bacterium]|jgi:hypothetical protein|nr:hypothetical protein [Candidatus Binatia bacterium]